MNLPFPKPTNREMARQNAIYCAEQNMIDRSQAWSAIAATFPEIEYVQLIADDRPEPPAVERLGGGTEPVDPDATAVMELPSVGHVQPSGRPEGMNGTITVDAVAWDVLRTLAIRHVLTSMAKGVTVDLMDEDTGPHVWELQFSRMPGSEIVHVSVSRPTT
ncbi:MAG: hypothetical protein ABW022_10985 [Actinoplanes sp.]